MNFNQKLRNPLLLLILAGFIVLLGFNLPPSEDAGFYGFAARAMANGAVLHEDIPMSTNSILLYLIGPILNATPNPLFALRLIYAAFYMTWLIGGYFLLLKIFSPNWALGAMGLTAIMLLIPRIAVDLGRNPIIPAMALITFAQLIVEKKQKHVWIFFAGVLLGLGCLIRETLLVLVIGYLGMLIFQTKNQEDRGSVKFLLFGFFGACLINVAILTVQGTWEGYIQDLILSGSEARYKGGMLSPERLLGNIFNLKTGISKFYGALIPLALISFWLTAPKPHARTLFLFRVMLVCSVILVVVVEKTYEYHAQIFIFYLCVLALYTINRAMPSLIVGIVEWKKKRGFLLYGGTVVGVLLGLLLVCQLWLIAEEYAFYYRLSRAIKSKEVYWNPYPAANALRWLKHDKVSAFSQYPTLFTSIAQYRISYPPIYDLSAAQNLQRPKIWADSLAALDAGMSQIHLDKTKDEFYSRWSEYGKLMEKRFINIAFYDFIAPNELINRITAYDNYRERVFIDQRFFKSNFNKIKQRRIFLKEQTTFRNGNPFPIIVRLSEIPDECLAAIAILSEGSRIHFDDKLTERKDLYSLVGPKKDFEIVNKSCKVNSVKLEWYKQNRSKTKSKPLYRPV